MKITWRIQAHKNRCNRGFSLVMVMTLGALMIMFSMALFSTQIQLQAASSKNLLGDQCLHDANLGINYALAMCNRLAFTGLVADLPARNNLPPGLTNRITDVQISFDTPQKISGKIVVIAQTGSIRRQIQATITQTPVNEIQAAKLLARYGTMSPRAQQQTLFDSGVHALNIQNIGNMNFTGAASNSPYLISNQTLNLSAMANPNIPGSVNISNDTPNPSLVLPSNAKFGGDVNFSGGKDSALDSQTNSMFDFRSDGGSGDYPASSNPNVLGNGIADGQGGTINSDYNNPSNLSSAPDMVSDGFANQSYSAGNKTLQVAPASGSASDSVSNIGSANLPIYTNGGEIAIDTMSISPGTYVSSGLNFDAKSTLNVGSSNSNGITTLNIQDGAVSQSAFDFNGNFSNLGGPSSFQIYYNGSKPININLSNMSSSTFSALIYAPKSKVNLNLGNKTFNGAIVANTLDFKNSTGTFNYDRSDLNAPGAPPNSSMAAMLIDQAGTSAAGLPFGQYRITEWVESNTW